MIRSEVELSKAGVAIGCITGFLDAAIIQLNIADSRMGISYLPPSMWILVPLVWIAWCTAVAMLLWVLHVRRSGTAVLMLAGPGLLLLSRLGPVIRHITHVSVVTAALFCLALGAALSVVIAWRWPGHPNGTFGWRWFAIGAGSLLIVSADAAQSARASTLPPAAGTTQARNVILIFLDTVRYDDARAMVNLGKFGAEAITFSNAWAPAPWTLPTHYAVFTGVDPWTADFDEEAEVFRRVRPPLAQRFAAHGYATTAILANPLLTPGTGLQAGFQHIDYSLSSSGCRSGLGRLVMNAYLHSGRRGPVCAWMSSSEVVERAARVLDGGRRPYFLALNFMDAHDPYFVEPDCGRPLRQYAWADREQLLNAERKGGTVAPGAATRMHNQYRAALRCIDRSLGVLLERIRRQPDYDRTIVAIVSDHGEQFGEHGLGGHGNSVYEQVLHVPLMVRIPGEPPRIVDDPVSVSSLHGTIVRTADLVPQHVGGLLSPNRRPAISNYETRSSSHTSGAFGIVGPTQHLIRWTNGREEIYNYKEDPQELRPAVKDAVSDQLRMTLLAAATNRQQRAAFNALGYLR